MIGAHVFLVNESRTWTNEGMSLNLTPHVMSALIIGHTLETKFNVISVLIIERVRIIIIIITILYFDFCALEVAEILLRRYLLADICLVVLGGN